MAINLSFGTVFGPHNGTSLLETYIVQLADRWKSVIVIGMGNEDEAAGHTSGVVSERSGGLGGRTTIVGGGNPNQEGRLSAGNAVVEVELAVGFFERGLSVQLWKSYADEFDIVLIHPGGEEIGPISERLGTARYRIGGTELLVFMENQVRTVFRRKFFLIFFRRKPIWTAEYGNFALYHAKLWMAAMICSCRGVRLWAAVRVFTVRIRIIR